MCILLQVIEHDDNTGNVLGIDNEPLYLCDLGLIWVTRRNSNESLIAIYLHRDGSETLMS